MFVYGDKEQGIPGAVARASREAVAQSVYDEIVDFGDYAFNKAHSVCYAVVAYQTAYLKYHYPPAVYGGAHDLRPGRRRENRRIHCRV